MNVFAKNNLGQCFAPWPTFSEDEILKVSEVLSSGKVNYWTGLEGRTFEEEFANVIGVKYAVALMNGTVALEAALAALGVSKDDEVITTCRTFIASASCIVMRGAKPVLADVDYNSQNISLESIEKAITKKTKAIIVVHLAGWPCDMDPIMALAKKYNLFVIEDCAQAHGAKYNNRPVGSIGDIGAFSFCQDKIITTGGEGGMITTNDKKIWEKVWSLKDHGKSYQSVQAQKNLQGFRWLHESFGTNWRMTEMQAAIGRLQLKKLPTWTKLRQYNASFLTSYFKKIPGLRIPEPASNIFHAYYKYYVFVIPQLLKTDWNRDKILKVINEKGVLCYSGSCSEIYLEKAFDNSRPAERFRIAKELGETSLMFLVHPTLSKENMIFTAQVVKQVMQEAIL